MCWLCYKAFQDKKGIEIKDGMLRLQKILKSYKDFGNKVYNV